MCDWNLGLWAGSCSLGYEPPWLKCSWLLHPLPSQMGWEVFCRGCHRSVPCLSHPGRVYPLFLIALWFITALPGAWFGLQGV